MIFECKNDIVSISEHGKDIPEFKALYSRDATENKEMWYKTITYIYFVYCRDSVYHEVLPTYRKQLVCVDRLKEKGTFWKLFENDKDVRRAIEKFIELSTSPKEKLYLEAVTKIEEYIEFWKDTKISKANHDLVADTLKNSKDLLLVLNILEKQAIDEKNSRSVGGSKSTLFEE